MPDLSLFPESFQAALLEDWRHDLERLGTAAWKQQFLQCPKDPMYGLHDRSQTISFACAERGAPAKRGPRCIETGEPYEIHTFDWRTVHNEIDCGEIEAVPPQTRERIEKEIRECAKSYFKSLGGY